MKNLSPRLAKKLHKRWLPECCADASQSSYWRTRLFDSATGEVFQLSQVELSGLSRRTAFAVRKYGLRISVAVSDPKDAEAWMSDPKDAEAWVSEGGYVPFKFWATDFPMIVSWSVNNPKVR